MRAAMWHDPDRGIVVYENPACAEMILAHVPGARALHNGYVAAPDTLFNLQMLRKLGEVVPPPMRGYDWPHGPRIARPFESQFATANFLSVHPRALVLSDMGTGKTLAALYAADFLMGLHPKSKCLIVAPLSTLQRVWADAIMEHFIGRRSAVVLHGTAKRRLKLLEEDHDYYIVNHDGLGVGASYRKGQFELRGFAAALSKRDDIQLAIIDEISAYREARTKRSRLARLLVGNRNYLWGLSGTPTPNGPIDAYGIARLVNNYGESYVRYRERIMVKVSQWKWVYRQDAHKEARKLLSPSIRFALEDCVDLPDMVTQTRDVEMTEEQHDYFRILERDLHIILESGELTIANEAVLRQKLIQISCGAIYDENHVPHPIDCRPRISVLREVIDEAGGKVIVFAPLTSVVNMLSMALKDYSTAVITGAVGKKARDEIYQRFQEGSNPRIIIADPGTMSHGLNLHAAATIVWYGPTDRTET